MWDRSVSFPGPIVKGVRLFALLLLAKLFGAIVQMIHVVARISKVPPQIDAWFPVFLQVLARHWAKPFWMMNPCPFGTPRNGGPEQLEDLVIQHKIPDMRHFR